MSPSPHLLLVNGQVVSHQGAVQMWRTSGVKTGFGLFETLLARDGKIEALEEHHARLCTSAVALSLQAPSFETFVSHLDQALDLATLRTGLARLRWTTLAADVHVAEAEPFVPYSGSATVHLLNAPTPSVGPLVGHKTLSYGPQVWGLQQAKLAGADEGLWLNEHGNVAEGCTSNVFWSKSGSWFTPSLKTGALPGVMRALVLKAAALARIPVFEVETPISTLFTADEVFLTSSLRGLQGVKTLQSANSTATWEKSHEAPALKTLTYQLIESQCLAQTKIISNSSTYFASQAPAEHV